VFCNFIFQKTDSHSEIGRLLKIGKIAMRFSPNILAEKEFTQTLDLEKGMIRISGKKEEKTIEISCWIDANNPVIHVEGNANFPLSIDVINQLWRKEQRLLTGNERHSGYGVTFRDEPFLSEKDTVLQFNNAIGWCHENNSSIWQMTLDNQNISAFNTIGKDPLIGQRFGAIVGGKEFKKTSAIQLSTHANFITRSGAEDVLLRLEDLNLLRLLKVRGMKPEAARVEIAPERRPAPATPAAPAPKQGEMTLRRTA